MMTTGQVAIWSLIACGFCNSIMFPNIFALGITGLGPMTSKGVGADYDGGGWRGDFAGGAERADRQVWLLRGSSALPVICYLYIAFYGLVGSKPTRTVTM